MVETLASTPPKRSKVEGIKERSNYLREPVATELGQDTTHFSEEAVQILKFHGSYQQDNRDNRVKGQEKDYQMMLRTRNPGGFIPPQLYLALDRLADTFGNGTLRATTRQGFQLHGILKKNLKATISEIVRQMGSTLGACGDLNRNVMCPPAPYKNRAEYQLAWDYANRIADLLTPQTGAYYEIWLDGEKVISGEEHPEVKAARQTDRNGTIKTGHEEPIYGSHYMPRKFKCSVTVPGDNSIDLYTQDLTLVVITNNGELEGFNIYAGGGMGRTHNKEETFARIADEIGYVSKEDVYDLVKAIVATQRDYGDRFDRRHARMKYLLQDWGLAKFKETVEGYFGQKIAPIKPLPPWRYEDYLGWHEQGDGNLFLGLFVENGRVHNQGSLRLKTALGEIVQQFQIPLRVTANQNVILYEIEPSWRVKIESILQENGVIVNPEKIDSITRHAMACPALPTCGLAITESERALPGINQRIRNLLEQLQLQEEEIVIRMTGCPNGCARPYMAELGFVGSGVETYQIWLGGNLEQTRLARAYVEKLPIKDLEKFLEPLLVYFRQEKQEGERFGNFCDRVGFDALRQFSESYEAPPKSEPKDSRGRAIRYRIGVRDELYQRLKTSAQEQNKSMTQIVSEALEKYLQG